LVRTHHDRKFRTLTTGEILDKGLFNNDNKLKWILPQVKHIRSENKEWQSKIKERQKVRIYITGIEYVGKCNATCITVNSKDSLFVCENFIPTHNTATGLSMLMSNASKGIKYVLSNMDANIIEPSVEALYDFNMIYGDDESIKGDLKVSATGVMSLVAKESMAIRRNEFLSTLAGNPIFFQIVGIKGIANLLREAIKSLDMPSGSIIPSEQELEALDMQKKLFEQIQQMLQAIQIGQATADDLVAMLMQVLGQQQQGQGQSGITNRGTPAKPATLMASGEKAGGVESSLFVNTKRPPMPSRPPMPQMERGA